MSRLPFASALLAMVLGDQQRAIHHLPQVARRRRSSSSGSGAAGMAEIRAAHRARNLQRFGLDIAGNSLAVTEDRRRLRNARKQERQAA